MSTLPPLQPDLSAIDAAFVDLILIFLEQVLRIPTPVRDSIKQMEITEMLGSIMGRGLFLGQEWTVTVVLTSPLPLIGNTLLFVVDNRSGHFAINKMCFEPGCRPIEEQLQKEAK